MANKRINDLPEATSTTVGDKLAIDGDTTRSITVEHFLADNLVAIRALTGAADKGIQFTGPGAAETYDLTAAGKALLDDDDAEAQRATLGLENVDNTSDADKPISSATQTALDAKANSDDLADVATSGDYDDLSNKPTLGTAAAADVADFATAAQGATADSAVQPDDLATVATSGDYGDLTNQPFTVPAGGSTGQVLAKNSGTDGDTEWINESGGSPDPTIAYAWQLGMRGDNSTDNAPALQDWADGLPAEGGKIIFGPGKFLFNDKATFTFHPSATGPSDDKKTIGSIVVEGSGSDLTTLYFPDSDGLEFEASSFQHTVHIRDLSITTGVAGGHKALRIFCTFGFFGSYTAQHDIDGVTIRGDDGYGAELYWDRCVDLYNITSVNFDGNSFYGPVTSASASGSAYGAGVYIDGVTPSVEGSATTYNFTNNNLVFLGRALYIGTDVQAFSLGAGNHILNGCDGIYVAPGGKQVRQLNVIGTEISVNGDAITLGTAVSASIFSNNYIAVAPSKNGIVFATSDNAPNSMPNVVTGNIFVAKDTGAGDGVYVATNYCPVIVSDNAFLGLGSGVELTSGCAHAIVQNNAFMNCGNDVIDLGSGNIVGDGAWRSFSPSVTAGSGSFTSVTGAVHYKRIGRTVFVRGTVTITTNGTAASYVQVTLPTAAVAETPLNGSNRTTGMATIVTASGATLFITRYDGTYSGADGSVLAFNGSYEAAP